ncbi:MAG: pyridoxamine 5'-phosphate oxidase family protein [Actinobacteria bacterium]|nr:pyridoxamine 5'-phosphate oxidase family protein [Actinomycetota bacterium]
MSPRRDVSMTPEEISGFLSTPRSCVLTTLDADGWPHSAAMWFVPGDSLLSMWTYRRSQKAVNARRDPRASVVVEAGTAYGELRGVMVRGHLELVEAVASIAEIGRDLYERYVTPVTGIPYEDGPAVEVERQSHKRVGLILPFDRVTSWDLGKL